MTPVIFGPDGPNDSRRARTDWPSLLEQVPANGNWYEFTEEEVQFSNVNSLKNIYQYLQKRYGGEFEFSTKHSVAGNSFRLFARRL